MTEGFADFRGYRTWYRVTGALDAAKAPLVVLHGGPGCTHDYLDSLTELSGTGPGRRPLRPARQRRVHPPAGRRPRLLDRRALPRRARQPPRPPRHRRPVPRARPVVGRHARRRARRDQARAACARSSSPTRPASMALWLEAATGLRDELPEDVQDALHPARGGRHDRLGGVRRGHAASSTTATSAGSPGRTRWRVRSRRSTTTPPSTSR